MNKAYVVLGV